MESAFLAAICEAPEDDGPRLIFADWLEERGDERAARWAELIRVQCQRPRGGPWEFPQRKYDLLLWAQQHLVPAGIAPIFRRGFVEEVGCPLNVWLHGGPSLVARHPVQRVWISDRQPERIALFENARWTWSLIHLPVEFSAWAKQLAALFATEQEAREALSTVCIEWARASRPTLRRAGPSG